VNGIESVEGEGLIDGPLLGDADTCTGTSRSAEGDGSTDGAGLGDPFGPTRTGLQRGRLAMTSRMGRSISQWFEGASKKGRFMSK
jgi:hypothetical protein